MEVPLNDPYAVGLEGIVDVSDTPIPTTSGLIRPSSVGPKLLKEDIWILLGVKGPLGIPLMAPTVKIFFAFDVRERQSYESLL
jgi:hypothetical protein